MTDRTDTLDTKQLARKAAEYVETLCAFKPHRRTGSPGNREAVEYVNRHFVALGWDTDTTPFDCLDFRVGEVKLTLQDNSVRDTPLTDPAFTVYPGPFSTSCETRADLVPASSVEKLEKCRCRGKILLLYGEIAAEPLMPKNFFFYNPESHKRIYRLLEEKQPAAIITATGRNPSLVGGEYPFAMIEDGDFHIPSVYCDEDTGKALAELEGSTFTLVSRVERIPATASNVIARKNPGGERKVVVCAHIDARAGTPGATDDASGVAVLLLLAELLQDYNGPRRIELIAFNGEDYYSVGGQMDYLARYGSELQQVISAINIDDAGYYRGKSAFSLYEYPNSQANQVRTAFRRYKGILEGPQWYQGDHMIFVQKGIPAMAITTELLEEAMASVTHTKEDTPEMVDPDKLAEIAEALESLIAGL